MQCSRVEIKTVVNAVVENTTQPFARRKQVILRQLERQTLGSRQQEIIKRREMQSCCIHQRDNHVQVLFWKQQLWTCATNTMLV